MTQTKPGVFTADLIDILFPVKPWEGFNPVLIGSRATGHFSPRSDWDYLLFGEKQRNDIVDNLNDRGIHFTVNVENDSIKVIGIIKGLPSSFILNFVFINDSDTYDAWVSATEIMKNLPKTINKQQRIEFFNSLVVYYGGEPSTYPNYCS